MRMAAVNNIRKITSAMKMVATAKMRADLMRLHGGKHFGVTTVPTVFASDKYMRDKMGTVEAKKSLIVALASDKGLCGAINSQIMRAARDLKLKDRERYSILPVGEKSAGALVRLFPRDIQTAITEVKLPINFYTASAIGNHITNIEGDHEEIIIVYNEFINSLSQIVRRTKMMTKERFTKCFKNLVKYDVSEPEPEYASQYFYELYISSQIYHCMLNGAACEQASRMNAMGNASQNAGDILQGLTLKYNQARQARITMELIEIISGAESL